MPNKEPQNAEGKGKTTGPGAPGSFLHPSAVRRSLFIICRFLPPHPTLSRSTHPSRASGSNESLSTGGPNTTLRRLPAPVNHRKAATSGPGRGRGLWQRARIASNPWHPEIGVPAAVAGATDCLPIGAERDRRPVPGHTSHTARVARSPRRPCVPARLSHWGLRTAGSRRAGTVPHKLPVVLLLSARKSCRTRWALDIDYCFFAVPTGVYYRYPQSGAGAVIGRLNKSGDVSGLASRHGDSTWRAGGPIRRFRK
jgi:hypothetical protein